MKLIAHNFIQFFYTKRTLSVFKYIVIILERPKNYFFLDTTLAVFKFDENPDFMVSVNDHKKLHLYKYYTNNCY